MCVCVCASPSDISRYLHDFLEFAVIGRGSFCEVYQAKHRLDGCTYAVKKYMQPLETEAQMYVPALRACMSDYCH